MARNDAEGEAASAFSTLSLDGARRLAQRHSEDRIQRKSRSWMVLPAPAEAAPKSPTCQGGKCCAYARSSGVVNAASVALSRNSSRQRTTSESPGTTPPGRRDPRHGTAAREAGTLPHARSPRQPARGRRVTAARTARSLAIMEPAGPAERFLKLLLSLGALATASIAL